MKIVRFEDGTYGVRTYWWFGWRFLSLGGHTWSSKQHVGEFCKYRTLQEVERIIAKHSKKHIVLAQRVKDEDL
jgi:hypothetical protein